LDQMLEQHYKAQAQLRLVLVQPLLDKAQML